MEKSGSVTKFASVQKLSEAEEKVSPVQLETFAPFKTSFYCTYCGFADTGKFCSSCGKSLSLSKKQFLGSLIQRIKALGFKSLSTDLQNDQVEKSIKILNFSSLIKHDLHPFYNLGAGIIGLESCLRLEIILLVNRDEFNAEIDSVISDFFLNCIGEDRLKEINQLKKRDRIRNISIKLVAIDNNKATMSSNNLQLKGVVPKRRNLPKFRRKNKYSVTCSTSAILVDLDKEIISKSSQMRFDPVLHEVSMALHQLKEQIPATRSRNIANVLFGDVIDYFKAFGGLLSSPSIFAEAVSRGGYLTPRQIWSFYIIGILVPALLLYTLSLGTIKPSQVLVFSELPPILGEVVEGIFGVVFILLEVTIYYLTFRLFRRKGSFKKLFMAILVVTAFYSLISTTAIYIAEFLALDIGSMDYTDYYKNIEIRISQGLSLLYLYMAYPFFVKIFRVGLREIMAAFLIHTIIVYLPLQFLRMAANL